MERAVAAHLPKELVERVDAVARGELNEALQRREAADTVDQREG